MRGKAGELALLVLVLVALVALVVPLPTALMDLLLSVNLGASALLLLVALSTRRLGELGALPGLLLLSTLARLSLNVASTRLILLDADAGELIAAFGRIVVRGDVVVGGVVFLLLTVVNLVVIARGAERVAEVAARFSLDAMPGRQMSIDADLRAGAIDLTQARAQREELQRESSLYGAMDGAMRFVKGDAVAGLLITAVNLLGGLALGVGREGLGLGEAASVYTVLTIGDGLVSQLPALLVSTAAAVSVTRSSGGEGLGAEIAAQAGAHPRALWASAVGLVALGLAPGMPLAPLGLVGLGLGAAAWAAGRARGAEVAEEVARAALPAWIAVEVAPEALSRGRAALRRGWAGAQARVEGEEGVALPGLALRPCPALAPGQWRVLLLEVPEASGEGLEEALVAAEGVARGHLALALGPQEVSARVEALRAVAPQDVEAVFPQPVTLAQLTEVMQALVAEGVPVRDLRALLGGLAKASREGADGEALREAARQSLRRAITWRFAGEGRALRAWQLHPEVEAMLRDSLKRGEDGATRLRLPSGLRREIVDAAARSLSGVKAPVVLTSAELRPHAVALLRGACPGLRALSHAELLEDVRVEVAGTISVLR